MNTAEKIRLPDDCTVGYIIEWVLGVPLTRSNLFHSHLENLQQVSRPELHKQVRGVHDTWTQTGLVLFFCACVTCFIGSFVSRSP